MVCWKCKSEMPEGLKYCGNCGVHMNRAVWFVQWLFSKKGLPVLIGVLVLALVIGGVAIWQGRPAMEATLEETLDVVLYVPEEQAEEEPDFLKEIEKRNGYEVISYEAVENGYSAVLRVYAPDVYGVAKKVDAYAPISDQEMLLQVLTEEMKEAQIVEREVELSFVETGDGYEPILTDEFMDAYYGGIIRLYEEMLAEAINRAEGGQ